MRQKFLKIYKQKVFVHHYTEFMEQSHFDYCLANCEQVIQSYEDMEQKNASLRLGGFGWDEEQIDPYRFKPIV